MKAHLGLEKKFFIRQFNEHHIEGRKPLPSNNTTQIREAASRSSRNPVFKKNKQRPHAQGRMHTPHLQTACR